MCTTSAAYIQQKVGTRLQMPQDLSSVILQVSPGFSPATSDGSNTAGNGRAAPTRITATVDRAFGSAHVVIPVPKDATPASYNMQLWTPSQAAAGTGSSNNLVPNRPSGNAMVPNAASSNALVPNRASGNVIAPTTAPGIAVVPNSAASSSAAANGIARPLAVPSQPRPQAANAAVPAAPGKVSESSPHSSDAGARRVPAQPLEHVMVAVMPKPKAVMGPGVYKPTDMAPSNPASEPAGVVQPAPHGIAEPKFEALQSLSDGNGMVVAAGSRSGARRLQQVGSGPVRSASRVMPEPSALPDAPAAEPVAPVADAAVAGDEPSDSQPVQPQEDLVVPEQQEQVSVAPSGETAVSIGRPAVQQVLPSPPTPLQPLGLSLASVQFTVGDPRPPTAALVLYSSAAWVRPGGSVTAMVSARSYVGSDVSGAEVTLQWSTGKAHGQLVLSTNASGVAMGKVELGKLPAANRSEPGDVLSLQATWVGPTREPLLQSKTIK